MNPHYIGNMRFNTISLGSSLFALHVQVEVRLNNNKKALMLLMVQMKQRFIRTKDTKGQQPTTVITMQAPENTLARWRRRNDCN